MTANLNFLDQIMASSLNSTSISATGSLAPDVDNAHLQLQVKLLQSQFANVDQNVRAQIDAFQDLNLNPDFISKHFIAQLQEILDESARNVVEINKGAHKLFGNDDEKRNYFRILRILTILAPKLDLSTLKSLREVNSSFGHIVMDTMTHKNIYKIRFSFDKQRKLFVQLGRSRVGALQSFVSQKIINCSGGKNDQFLKFHFEGLNSENFGSSDLQDFFQVCGPHIKTLQLDFDAKNDSNGATRGVQFLNTLLTSQLVQLEELTLVKIPTSWQKMEFLKNATLPSLRILDTIGAASGRPVQDGGLLAEILKAAVNLKEWRSPATSISYLDDLQFFVDFEKIHLIQDLRLSTCHDLEYFQSLEKFSNSGPKLKKIDFDDFHLGEDADYFWTVAKIPEFISAILKSSSHTLTEIHLTKNSMGKVKPSSTLKIFEIIQWPRCPKVGQLKLQLVLDDLPRDLYFTFPALHTLVLRYWPDSVAYNEKNYPFGNEILYSVRRLEWPYGVDARTSPWFRKFPKTLPNLETLLVENTDDFPSIGCSIWQFRRLRNLKIGLNFDDPPNRTFPGLDSTFTGISRNKCKKLKAQAMQGLYQQSVLKHELHNNDLRINGSILDLKDLQTLEIKLSTSYVDSLTFITKMFALDLMPHVCIKFVDDEGQIKRESLYFFKLPTIFDDSDAD